MHEKQANHTRTRAPMIRYCSAKQLTIAEFDWPFETALDENNRWVKMSRCIPWDELADSYYQELSSQSGRPAKNARLVISAVIIKHKLSLSDAETVQQIQENPYMQYFVGLASYQMEAPFAPSLFVEVRKRMGQSVFEAFHQAIIDAHDGEKEKNDLESGHMQTDEKPLQAQPDNRADPVSETDEIQKQPPTHQGKLILDATVVEQAIRYPTDLSLLNEAREFSEKIIDILYPQTAKEKKPRIYREKARQAFLSVVKQRRPGRKKLRRGIRQQLQYLLRNLGHIEQLMRHWR